MASGSSSPNPRGGRWVPGSTILCDRCPRPAEWRFERARPVIGADVERSTHTYGCGIHWSLAQAEAKG